MNALTPTKTITFRYIPLCGDRASLVTGGRQDVSDDSSDVGSQLLSSSSASAHVELGERVSERFEIINHSTDLSTFKCVLFIHTLDLHGCFFARAAMSSAEGFSQRHFRRSATVLH